VTAIEHNGRIYRPESALRRGLRALGGRAGNTAAAAIGTAARAVVSVAKARTVPAVAHLREHAYSIISFGLIDAAMFLHSEFTGLIVTGVSFAVFEWKVQGDGATQR
jgi:hypothetical protein